MAKRLGDILQSVTDRIPKGAAAPKAPAEDVCPMCGGAGWLRMTAPVGDPNFGRLVPCDCRLAETEEQTRRELEELSNMEAFSAYTFERFEPNVDPTVKRAFETAQEYATNPVGWLLLCGPCGTGKTHIAAAIANESIHSHLLKSVFMNVPDLLDYLREAFNPNSLTTYDERFETVRSVPLLVLDDLGTENATSWAREKLYQIINHRYNAQLPTVITTNQRLEDIEDRIRSRISDVRLVTQLTLDGPDYRTGGQTPRRGRAKTKYR